MKPLVRKLPSLIAAVAVVVAMVLFLAFPTRYTEGVREGVSLWATCVLPATFPFLFLTALFRRQKIYPRLTKLLSPVAGKAFRISGAGGCAAVVSALSGYPVGAKSVLDLFESGQAPKEETFRLACLCSTTGPMFLVGAVGSRMFGSAKLGWIMFCSHLAAVWLVCLFLRFTGKKTTAAPVRLAPERGDALYESLYSSVISILCVGGSIALFFAFGQMLADVGAFAGIKDPYLTAVLRGLLEMTTGCALLAASATPLHVATCCFLVTFGGLCVLVQQFVYFSRAGVKPLHFLGVKLLQSALAFGICFAFCLACGV